MFSGLEVSRRESYHRLARLRAGPCGDRVVEVALRWSAVTQGRKEVAPAEVRRKASPYRRQFWNNSRIAEGNVSALPASADRLLHTPQPLANGAIQSSIVQAVDRIQRRLDRLPFCQQVEQTLQFVHAVAADQEFGGGQRLRVGH